LPDVVILVKTIDPSLISLQNQHLMIWKESMNMILKKWNNVPGKWKAAPAGKENNWIQTIPGKGWFIMLRLFGPLETWFDKTWRPGEIEQTDRGMLFS